MILNIWSFAVLLYFTDSFLFTHSVAVWRCDATTGARLSVAKATEWVMQHCIPQIWFIWLQHNIHGEWVFGYEQWLPEKWLWKVVVTRLTCKREYFATIKLCPIVNSVCWSVTNLTIVHHSIHSLTRFAVTDVTTSCSCIRIRFYGETNFVSASVAKMCSWTLSITACTGIYYIALRSP